MARRGSVSSYEYQGIRIPRFPYWHVIDGPFRGNYGAVVIYQSRKQPYDKKAVKIPYSYLNPEVIIAEARKQQAVANRRSGFIGNIIQVQEARSKVPPYIEMEFYPHKLDAYLSQCFLLRAVASRMKTLLIFSGGYAKP